MSAISFRPADLRDAKAIGLLHVVSWRETYGGILPDRLLEGLSAEARSDMWSSVLSGSAGQAAVFVATRKSDIIGFGACGGQRDAALKEKGFDAEIGALYVLKVYQRAGIGMTLMRLMAASLLSAGHRAGCAWVLRENVQAREFYERLSGVLVGERVEEFPDTTMVEFAYGWSDLASLMR